MQSTKDFTLPTKIYKKILGTFLSNIDCWSLFFAELVSVYHQLLFCPSIRHLFSDTLGSLMNNDRIIQSKSMCYSVIVFIFYSLPFFPPFFHFLSRPPLTCQTVPKFLDTIELSLLQERRLPILNRTLDIFSGSFASPPLFKCEYTNNPMAGSSRIVVEKTDDLEHPLQLSMHNLDGRSMPSDWRIQYHHEDQLLRYRISIQRCNLDMQQGQLKC